MLDFSQPKKAESCNAHSSILFTENVQLAIHRFLIREVVNLVTALL